MLNWLLGPDLISLLGNYYMNNHWLVTKETISLNAIIKLFFIFLFHKWYFNCIKIFSCLISNVFIIIIHDNVDMISGSIHTLHCGDEYKTVCTGASSCHSNWRSLLDSTFRCTANLQFLLRHSFQVFGFTGRISNGVYRFCIISKFFSLVSLNK